MRDAVIVLSHRREPDGGLSNEYIGRLEKGIKLVLGGKAENLVLCSETATEDVKKVIRFSSPLYTINDPFTNCSLFFKIIHGQPSEKHT